MLLVSLRPLQSITTAEKESLARFHLTSREVLSQPFYCDMREDGYLYILNKEQFFDRIKALSPTYTFFLTHGYTVSPDDGIKSTREIHDHMNKNHVFDHDLFLGIPVIWNTHQELNLLEGYFEDKPMAEASGLGFYNFLNDLAVAKFNWFVEGFYTDLILETHSMGNRLLKASMKHVTPDSKIALLFRWIIMIAADVANETLHKGEVRFGDRIPKCCVQLLNVHARDDKALEISTGVNGFYTSMQGENGIEDFSKVANNVYELDYSARNQHESGNPIGHNYHTPNKNGESSLLDMLWEWLENDFILHDHDNDRKIEINRDYLNSV